MSEVADTMVLLETPSLKRVLVDSPTGFGTASFRAMPSPTDLMASPTDNEGTLALNGKHYVLGGRQAGSIGYLRHCFVERPRGGRRCEVVFGGADGLPQGLIVKLIYDMPDACPVLIKSIRVENDSDTAVWLNGMQIESFTPAVTGPYSLILENDYVRDAMTVNGKRARSPWIENQAEYVDALLHTRAEPTRFAYPVELDRWIPAAGRFDSFRVYEFVTTTSHEELRGLAFRRATRELFPWTRVCHLCCALAPARQVADYYRGIELAAEVGYEAVLLSHGWVDGKLTSPLFTNYNDYRLREDLFPNGWHDVWKLTNFAHARGMQIAFYAVYVQTWRNTEDAPEVHKNNRWELKWAADDDSQRWGRALDPATDWGLFVNRKIEDAIIRGGFDAWHLDGPYYGDINVAEGRGVRPGGASQLLAWERQVAFYQRMRALRLHGEAAQGFCAFAHGMSRITTSGYDESDFWSRGIRDQILAMRRGAYCFTKVYRPEQASSFIPVMSWSEAADGPSLEPLEKNAELYDAYLANCYGYGFEGRAFQRVPYEGPRSKAVVLRWLDFWKSHADFFKEGYLMHVREPDGRRIDGIAHVILDDQRPRMLVVVYNPTDEEREEEITLPVGLLDWPTEGWAARAEDGRMQKAARGRIRVRVPARNATWYEMSLESLGPPLTPGLQRASEA